MAIRLSCVFLGRGTSDLGGKVDIACHERMSLFGSQVFGVGGLGLGGGAEASARNEARSNRSGLSETTDETPLKDSRGASLNDVNDRRWSAALDGHEASSLKCVPITLYPSEDFTGSGSQIGACDMLISYAIKGGKVRVLNRESAARTLLRGHDGAISDLSFALNEQSSNHRTLASCCDVGATTIWRLSVRVSDDEEIASDKVRSVTGIRAAWGEGTCLATVHDAMLSVFSDVVASGEKLERAAHEGSPIVDLRWFSVARLVTCGGNTIRCWTESLVQLAEWSPGGLATQVAMVREMACAVVGGNLILCDDEMTSWVPYEPGSRLRLLVSNDLILVSSGSMLRVAHVNGNKLDYVTQFDLGTNVSSLAVLAAPLSAKHEDTEADAETLGYELHLFCVQTKAIQQFFLRPSSSYPPSPPPLIIQESVPLPPTSMTPVDASSVISKTVIEAATSKAIEAANKALAARLDLAGEENKTNWVQCENRLAGIERSVEQLSKAHEVLAAAIAPAVEAAVSTMFTTLDAALRDRLETFERLEAQRLEKFDKAILALTKSANSSSSSTAVPAQPVLQEDTNLRRRELLKDRIAELIETDQDYDGAVYKAVEASDVEVLLFAIQKCDANKVDTIQPLPFQQLTLICVVQQLAATLNHHPEYLALKFDWIQFAVLAIDPNDHQIQSHVPEVLRQLKQALEALPPHLRNQNASPVTILTHIVNSLLNNLHRPAPH